MVAAGVSDDGPWSEASFRTGSQGSEQRKSGLIEIWYFYQSLCKYCSYFIILIASIPQLTGKLISHGWILPKLGTVT